MSETNRTDWTLGILCDSCGGRAWGENDNGERLCAVCLESNAGYGQAHVGEEWKRPCGDCERSNGPRYRGCEEPIAFTTADYLAECRERLLGDGIDWSVQDDAAQAVRS